MTNVLITGGAGFVGCNLANYFLNKKGYKVTIFDNLSRKGTDKNLKWLIDSQKNSLKFIKGDIRDFEQIKKAVNGIDIIYHLAGQVAVTTSVENPREDFEINAFGTFNLLEAAKNSINKPIVLFTSTNKVYGGMEDVAVIQKGDRYEYKDYPHGISEERNIDFYSPYGCSKGAADQYMRDYYRIYEIKTVVFRMSCIYGTRQLGNEDQGWVAHFIISSILDRSITIYGDGKQVRDILFVEDIVRVFDMAVENIDITKGKIYNIGGGYRNTISLIELIGYIEKKIRGKVKYTFKDWRPGDQKIYISNITKIKEDIGWEPQISKEGGIDRLCEWVKDNIGLFE